MELGLSMNRQIIIGFTTEGTTDVRFLESIIQRSFESIAFECDGQIEVLPVQYIEKQSGSFLEVVRLYAQKAAQRGIMVLCVHCDADAKADTDTFKDKIDPAFDMICNTEGSSLCKTLVPIVPVAMTEAWMLSDTELLKAEIGTDKNDADLGIDRFPEDYSDPKECIQNAIRIGRQDLTKRRRRDLSISELYLPIGQQVLLSRLESLPSYRKFREAVRYSFKQLKYLR
jgi:hypothetical protein